MLYLGHYSTHPHIIGACDEEELLSWLRIAHDR
jgi:hypothetical protein